ncbi:MAG TPA: T9SS type A sorting domain-containing protein, partial [Bacteroidia bacterium]|nr:T9SS type A sorting domain-containing protein [Bacteroidia bacterium]
ITANGGTSPYTYSWATGATSSSIIVSPTVMTTYTYVVGDSHGCTSTSYTAVVNVNPPLNVTTGAPLAICSGSMANINAIATGGDGVYTYTWQPGGLIGQNLNVSPSSSGYYTVTVTDACTTPAAMGNMKVIVDPVLKIISIDSNITGGCTNSVWAVTSGGTKPFTYSWNTSPVQTKDTATNLCNGIYKVTITDSIGCSVTDSIRINSTIGIAEVQNNSSVKLYPVPTNGNLNISITGNGFVPQALMVYDITGRELMNERVKANSNMITIDVSKLENGTYILKLVNGNNQKLARFIVSK